jgi:HAD superfamily hydrolase (TIGR01509 family)
MERLVIFDCDGVLVDSEFVANKVFSDILFQYGYSISFEECVRKFTGVDEHSCRKIIMEESGLQIPEDYWTKSEPILLKAFESELQPLLKSLLEILDELNIPRCVASNSSKQHVSHCLTLTNQLKFFNEKAIFTARQVSRPKPAPDLFLFAAKEMGVKPENCIVVEDSSAGASAAFAAGMQVMMFLGGSHAHFDWYRDKVAVHDVPMQFNCEELSDAILHALKIF